MLIAEPGGELLPSWPPTAWRGAVPPSGKPLPPLEIWTSEHLQRVATANGDPDTLHTFMASAERRHGDALGAKATP
jgi:hypothetical protein